jgi:hypothetical protein
MDKPLTGLSTYKSTASILCPVKAENTWLMPLPDDHAEKSNPLPQSQGESKHQADMRSCSYSHSQLGSSHSEKRTTEQPGHMAHFGGSRDCKAPGMERQCQLPPLIQKLLGPMEIPRYRNSILECHWNYTGR